MKTGFTFKAGGIFLLPLLFLAAGCSLSPSYSPADLSQDIIVQSTDNYIALRPVSGTALDTGFIFYPGGLVEPEAYIPMLTDIAAAGFEVFIVPMPLDLAIFAPNRAEKVMNAETKSAWVIGGHSLGGVMAAQYAAGGSQPVQGLVLMAAYPAKNVSLAGSSIPVLSIYATEDGLTVPADIEDSKTRLPADTEFYEITGGNHAQFGSYGVQKGDGTALITAEAQHELVSARVVSFLESRS